MNTLGSWVRVGSKCPSLLRYHSTSIPVRVRYAPSPTGYLHLGGVRTALLNFLFARANAGTFVLRIEDTDQTREVPGAADQLEVDLDWLGLSPDESPRLGGAYGPYKQSQRLVHYQHFTQQLLDSGHAYRCFCSKQRLSSLAHGYDGRCRNLDPAAIAKNLATDIPHSIRMRIPSGQTVVEDLVYGHVAFDNSTIDEQILLKSDGFPTYHLANIVDDHLMKITHVIRGEEWLPSTPKHVLLYRALGLAPPAFMHVPLLVNEKREKLSKRHGDISLQHFRKEGYSAATLLNFVALLGLTPEGLEASGEVMSLDELVKRFRPTSIHKSAAVVDFKKMDWLANQHFRNDLKDPEKLEKMAFEAVKALQEKGIATEAGLCARCLPIMGDRFRSARELALHPYFFVRPNFQPGAVLTKLTAPAAQQALATLFPLLVACDDVAWAPAPLLALCQANFSSIGQILNPLRLALTVSSHLTLPGRDDWLSIA